MTQVQMFRRGVTVAASIIIGAQTASFGAWLAIPGYDTFSTSRAYATMQQLFDSEAVWGLSFLATGGAVFGCGLTMWLRLQQARPLPLWFRVLSAALLLAELILVVSIFYLASRESPAAPLFAVMMVSVAVIVTSALDELGLYDRLARLLQGVRARLWR